MAVLRRIAPKFFRALTMTVVFYVLPVLPNADLLRDLRLLLIIVMCFALDLTQPSLASKAESPTTDRHSLRLVMMAAFLCHVLPIVEWVYFPPSTTVSSLELLGALMVVGGTALRGWAIQILGRFFSAHVELQTEHLLIQDGPYRVIRHPSYAGATLFLMGVPLMLQTPVSFVCCALLLLAAYGYRIPIEEQMLQRHFGVAFETYASSTKRLIPYIW